MSGMLPPPAFAEGAGAKSARRKNSAFLLICSGGLPPRRGVVVYPRNTMARSAASGFNAVLAMSGMRSQITYAVVRGVRTVHSTPAVSRWMFSGGLPPRRVVVVYPRNTMARSAASDLNAMLATCGMPLQQTCIGGIGARSAQRKNDDYPWICFGSFPPRKAAVVYRRYTMARLATSGSAARWGTSGPQSLTAFVEEPGVPNVHPVEGSVRLCR